MSVKFRIPVIVNERKSVDSLFRFDIGSGYFEGESPLKYVPNAEIVQIPNVSGEVFDSRPLRYYKSDDYFSFASLFLTGNPYLKQVVSTSESCYVSGVLDDDYKNFLSLTPDLSGVNGFVGDIEYAYGSYTKTCFGVAGNYLVFIQKNSHWPTYIRVNAYDISNGINLLYSRNYGLSNASPITIFEDTSGVFYCFVDSSKNIRVYPINSPSTLTLQTAISLTVDNAIGFVPDVLQKTLIIFYNDRILEITSSDTIRNSVLYGLSQIDSSSGSVWSRGLIAQSGYVTSVNNRRILIAVRYFLGFWRVDLTQEDIDGLSSGTGVWLYDITDTSTTYYPIGRLYISRNECVRGIIKLNDTKFLVSLLNLYDGRTKLVMLDISNGILKVKNLVSIPEDIYQVVNNNDMLQFFSEKIMYNFKSGMATKVNCDVNFDESSTYPRSGKMKVSAYDIFGNEAYARIAIKLKSPNVTFGDGSTLKIVNFYPNNTTEIDLKLLYSSVVSIETDIIEVVT